MGGGTAPCSNCTKAAETFQASTISESKSEGDFFNSAPKASAETATPEKAAQANQPSSVSTPKADNTQSTNSTKPSTANQTKTQAESAKAQETSSFKQTEPKSELLKQSQPQQQSFERFQDAAPKFNTPNTANQNSTAHESAPQSPVPNSQGASAQNNRQPSIIPKSLMPEQQSKVPLSQNQQGQNNASKSQAAPDSALARMKAMLAQNPTAKSNIPQPMQQTQKAMPGQPDKTAAMFAQEVPTPTKSPETSKTVMAFSEMPEAMNTVGSKQLTGAALTKPQPFSEKIIEKMDAAVLTVKNFVSETTKKITSYVEGKIQDIMRSVQNTGAKITKYAADIQEKVATFISNAVEKVATTVNAAIQKIVDAVSTAITRLQTAISSIVSKAMTIVNVVKDFVATQFQLVMTKVISVLTPIAAFAAKITKQVVEGAQKAAEKILVQIEKGIAWIYTGMQQINQFVARTSESFSNWLGKMFKGMNSTASEETGNPLAGQYAGLWAKLWRKIRKRKKTSIFIDDADLELEEESLVEASMPLAPSLSPEQREQIRRQSFLKELTGQRIISENGATAVSNF